jgi:translation initiation factor IF-3
LKARRPRCLEEPERSSVIGRRGRRHQDKTPRFEHRINERIRAREVRVVDENGENLGVMHPRDATRIAADRKLDLVEVSPNAVPPVCKILDYGKWRYERDKQKKESKPAKSAELREVKMRPKIGEHDFQVKTRQVVRLLQGGDKVKVLLRFRGREVVHQDLAEELLMRVSREVGDIGTIESKPQMQGRQMMLVLAPAH